MSPWPIATAVTSPWSLAALAFCLSSTCTRAPATVVRSTCMVWRLKTFEEAQWGFFHLSQALACALVWFSFLTDWAVSRNEPKYWASGLLRLSFIKLSRNKNVLPASAQAGSFWLHLLQAQWVRTLPILSIVSRTLL